MKAPSYDVAIIGGGPAGLSAALILGRCLRSVIVCDEGRPRNEKSKAVHNFLSREGIAPDRLLQIARDELRPYEVEIRKGVVSAAARRGKVFRVRFESGEEVRAKKLLLATGIRDNCPPIDGVGRFIGRGVYYCSYCDGYTVRGEPLVALGRGVAGAELALALTTWTSDVSYCLHGSPPPRGAICQRLERCGIKLHRARIVRVEGERRLEWLHLAGGERLPCRGLFIQHGCRPQSDLAEQLGCDFTRSGAVRTRKGCRTTVDSVFVAGDAADVPHAVVSAAASGADAAFHINQELREDRASLAR
jgi:thioredoxin reductase